MRRADDRERDRKGKKRGAKTKASAYRRPNSHMRAADGIKQGQTKLRAGFL